MSPRARHRFFPKPSDELSEAEVRGWTSTPESVSKSSRIVQSDEILCSVSEVRTSLLPSFFRLLFENTDKIILREWNPRN